MTKTCCSCGTTDGAEFSPLAKKTCRSCRAAETRRYRSKLTPERIAALDTSRMRARSCERCQRDYIGRGVRFCSAVCRLGKGDWANGPKSPDCVECGTLLVRREREGWDHWTARMFCKRSCRISSDEKRKLAVLQARRRKVELHKLVFIMTYYHPDVRAEKRERFLVRANANRKLWWNRLPPEERSRRIRVQNTRRAGRIYGAVGTYTRQEWEEKCSLFAHLCAYCGEAKPLTADHVVPLIRGGTNYITNVVPACKSCNSSKGHLMLADWFAGVKKRRKAA